MNLRFQFRERSLHLGQLRQCFRSINSGLLQGFNPTVHFRNQLLELLLFWRIRRNLKRQFLELAQLFQQCFPQLVRELNNLVVAIDRHSIRAQFGREPDHDSSDGA